MSEAQVTSVEHLPRAVVVHLLPRELRKREVDGLCTAIDEARAVAPALPFILDMAQVHFAPSLALGVLVGLSKEFKNRGQRLIFAALQPNLREAFAITHMDRTVEIVSDVASAQQSLGA